MMPRLATTVDSAAVPARRRPDRWFYFGMGVTALVIALAGFVPGMISTTRRGPLTLLVAAHAALFGLWLLFFMTQTALVEVGRTDVHRRLGLVGTVLAAALVVSGYATAILQGRRGFDLSGDLNIGTDSLGPLVFPLADIATFGLLVGLGVCYRRRPDVHKRLMLLATVGGLMPAPLAHFLGHYHAPPPLILVPLAALLSASAVHDKISRARIHPVSLRGAVLLLVWFVVQARIIAPSAAWHRLAAWLIQ
jgi:uncharacterized membrane protein YozB (DUF420 family)